MSSPKRTVRRRCWSYLVTIESTSSSNSRIEAVQRQFLLVEQRCRGGDKTLKSIYEHIENRRWSVYLGTVSPCDSSDRGCLAIYGLLNVDVHIPVDPIKTETPIPDARRLYNALSGHVFSQLSLEDAHWRGLYRQIES